MASFVMYADIEVHEWGEEDIVRRVGPYSPADGFENDPQGAEEHLHYALTEQGDDVLRIDVEYV